MADPITTEDLAAIKARAEKATPGPWTTGGGATEVYGADDQWLVQMIADGTEADAEFIAHARTDIEQLVAEVERFHELLGEDERDRDIAASLINAGRERVADAFERLTYTTALKEAVAELEATKAKLAEAEQRITAIRLGGRP
jgi:hypothetical protein